MGPRLPAVIRSARRQCLLDQSHPVAGPHWNGVVVEIVSVGVEFRAVAVAEEDVGAWALLEHEREILAAHGWWCVGVDAILTGYLGRDLGRKGSLSRSVHSHRIAAGIAHTGFGAKAAGELRHELGQSALDHVLHSAIQRPHGPGDLGG